MPRMSKKRRLEWSFFLRQVKVGNSTCDRITYNDLCRGCTHSCKQSFRADLIACPHFSRKASSCRQLAGEKACDCKPQSDEE